MHGTVARGCPCVMRSLAGRFCRIRRPFVAALVAGVCLLLFLVATPVRVASHTAAAASSAGAASVSVDARTTLVGSPASGQGWDVLDSQVFVRSFGDRGRQLPRQPQLRHFRPARVDATFSARAWRFEAVHTSTGQAMTFSDVLALWNSESPLATAFMGEFVSLIAGEAGIDMARDAVYFETPPVSSATASHTPFEFVLLPALSLGRVRVDGTPFSSQLARCQTSRGEDVVVFPSLGRDANLVVPCPTSGVADALTMLQTHAHVAAFCRASLLQSGTAASSLWRRVARAFEATLSSRAPDEPTFLSTSGDGVAWLHVRLDSRPKYYQYAPYRRRRIPARSAARNGS